MAVGAKAVQIGGVLPPHRPPSRRGLDHARGASGRVCCQRVHGRRITLAAGAVGSPAILLRSSIAPKAALACLGIKPVIQLSFAADGEDLRRLVTGVRLTCQIAYQPEIARHLRHMALLTEEMMSSDDEAIAAYVRATTATLFHPCGTARMGRPATRWAVAGQRCQFRTIPNLRVADASVMPTILRANINLTLPHDRGEHAADWMCGKA